jgi:hypothetical protein
VGAVCSTGCKGKANQGCSGKQWNVTKYNDHNQQVEYDYSMQLFDSAESATEMVFDHETATYHFDYTCTADTPPPAGQTKVCSPGRHQVWLDTPASLSVKYSKARELGLRGVFLWTADKVNYSAPDHQAQGMWDALKSFTR